MKFALRMTSTITVDLQLPFCLSEEEEDTSWRMVIDKKPCNAFKTQLYLLDLLAALNKDVTTFHPHLPQSGQDADVE